MMGPIWREAPLTTLEDDFRLLSMSQTRVGADHSEAVEKAKQDNLRSHFWMDDWLKSVDQQEMDNVLRPVLQMAMEAWETQELCSQEDDQTNGNVQRNGEPYEFLSWNL